MITIIAGDRGFNSYKKFCEALEEIGTDISHVFTMGNTPPNSFGMRWAFDNNLPCKAFPPDMKKFMIAEAEDIIYFKKRKSSPQLLEMAQRGGLEIYEYEF